MGIKSNFTSIYLIRKSCQLEGFYGQYSQITSFSTTETKILFSNKRRISLTASIFLEKIAYHWTKNLFSGFNLFCQYNTTIRFCHREYSSRSRLNATKTQNKHFLKKILLNYVGAT
jgi:hypothetical protein